jgi:hypothetical protein
MATTHGDLDLWADSIWTMELVTFSKAEIHCKIPERQVALDANDWLSSRHGLLE